MAPVGAHIASGVQLNQLGPSLTPNQLKRIPLTYELNEQEATIKCTIQYVDDFGNLTTNIHLEGNYVSNSDISLAKGQILTLMNNNLNIEGKYASHFAEVSRNTLLFIEGSTGFLEISINQGNASEQLNISSGDEITIKF
jgi:S-adenosylmethionine hydrolase